jgi:hypothetical protein
MMLPQMFPILLNIQLVLNLAANNFLSLFLTTSYVSSEAKVNLENEDGEMVTIKGLDDMGFLSVINSSNEVLSVQPDGNSFDMMRNLIKIKTR